MTIPVYTTRPLVKQWVSSIEPELKYFINIIYFKKFELFIDHIKKNSVINIDDSSKINIIVAIDLADAHLEVLERIHSINPGIKVILIDLITDSSKILDYLRYGYNSLIEVGTKPHDIIAIIQKLFKQNISICPDLMDRLLHECFYKKTVNGNGHLQTSFERKQTLRSVLSEKQQLVFDYLIIGKTYKEISQSLGVSFYVVNQRAKTIYKKLGIKSRVELLNLVMS